MAHGKHFKQGYFEPSNPDKYRGTGKPRYDSSWEKVVMEYLDSNPYIHEWVSDYVIPYYSSTKGRKARYLVDFVFTYTDKNGEKRTVMAEVKPLKETMPPKKGRGRKRSTVLQEEVTWINNSDKWNAAEQYAKERGWKFCILTENDIFRS